MRKRPNNIDADIYLNHNSFTPLYVQIFEILRNRIENGEFKPGQQLPSEHELIKQYRVSRITVTAALQKLVHAGLAYRLRGKGTFVSRPKIMGISSIGSFSSEIRQRGLIPNSRLISTDLLTIDEEIAQKLEISSDEKCYKIARIRYANDEPVAFETAYLPYKLFPDIDSENLEKDSLYEIMEKKYGFLPSWVDSTFEAVTIDDISGKYLELERGAPILSVRRVTRDPNYVPLEWVHSLYRGDRFCFSIGSVPVPD